MKKQSTNINFKKIYRILYSARTYIITGLAAILSFISVWLLYLLRSSQGTISLQEKKIQQLSTTIADLNNKIAELNKQNELSLNDSSKNQEENKKLISQLIILNNELNTSRETISSQSKQSAGNASILNQKEERIKQLSTTIANLNNKIAELNKQNELSLDELNASREKISSQFKQSAENNSILKQEIQQLHTTIAGLNNKITELNKQNELLLDELNALRKTISSQSKQSAKNNSILKQKEEIIQQLHTTIADLNNKIAELNKQNELSLDELNASREKISSQFKQSAENNSILKQEIQQLHTTIAGLNNKITELNKQNELLLDELNALRKTISSQSKQSAKNNSILKQKEEIIQQLHTTIADLNNKIAELNKQNELSLDELNASREKISSQFKQSAENNSILKQEIQQLHTTIAGLNNKITELNKQNELLLDELNALRKTISSQSKQSAKNNSILKQKEEIIQQLHTTIAVLNKQNGLSLNNSPNNQAEVARTTIESPKNLRKKLKETIQELEGANSEDESIFEITDEQEEQILNESNQKPQDYILWEQNAVEPKISNEFINHKSHARTTFFNNELLKKFIIEGYKLISLMNKPNEFIKRLENIYDVFGSIDDVKKEFSKLDEKYNSQKLPNIINGVLNNASDFAGKLSTILKKISNSIHNGNQNNASENSSNKFKADKNKFIEEYLDETNKLFINSINKAKQTNRIANDHICLAIAFTNWALMNHQCLHDKLFIRGALNITGCNKLFSLALTVDDERFYTRNLKFESSHLNFQNANYKPDCFKIGLDIFYQHNPLFDSSLPLLPFGRRHLHTIFRKQGSIQNITDGFDSVLIKLEPFGIYLYRDLVAHGLEFMHNSESKKNSCREKDPSPVMKVILSRLSKKAPNFCSSNMKNLRGIQANLLLVKAKKFQVPLSPRTRTILEKQSIERHGNESVIRFTQKT